MVLACSGRAIEKLGRGQALVRLEPAALPEADKALLDALGDDLKFVLITSLATVVGGPELAVAVTPSTAKKCERCWHYADDVGHDAAHPTICGRCVSNLHGAGETRQVA